jgi:hypothetical protein
LKNENQKTESYEKNSFNSEKSQKSTQWSFRPPATIRVAIRAGFLGDATAV